MRVSLLWTALTLVVLGPAFPGHGSVRSATGLPSLSLQVPLAEEEAGLADGSSAWGALSGEKSDDGVASSLETLLEAIDVMQNGYFDRLSGIWPSAIDWTAAVLNTHVSATLSTIVSSLADVAGDGTTACSRALAWWDVVERFFAHTCIFYFGENAFSLRHQAYDDMLWVVLGWLENVKLINHVATAYDEFQPAQNSTVVGRERGWHGRQFSASAAHRARTFYDLAWAGWDTTLCGGGMLWSPHTRTPYKNSITNELFISASISMFLYFPGDQIGSPNGSGWGAHDPQYLTNAVQAYEWLRDSNMTSPDVAGLFADGFHIHGWHRKHSGKIDRGTGRCDELNSMIYTYNQGVVLTGLRGLWLAGGSPEYLDDGHALVSRVIRATGWRDATTGSEWAGLGRSGVLEDYCDSRGQCSQNGQTFKGIFFHHLAEFCRPLSALEEGFLSNQASHNVMEETMSALGREVHLGDEAAWASHLRRCEGYQAWVRHNAKAAAVTKDRHGRFGGWWGQPALSSRSSFDPGRSWAWSSEVPRLPANAIDYQNVDTLADSRSAGGRPQRPVGTPRAGPDRQHDDAQPGDPNDRGRGRTVESHSGGLAVFRALRQWERVGATGS